MLVKLLELYAAALVGAAIGWGACALLTSPRGRDADDGRVLRRVRRRDLRDFARAERIAAAIHAPGSKALH